MRAYFFLAAAIVSEIFGTSMLKVSDGFTKPVPGLAAAASFGLAFYFLSLALVRIPLGTAYAVWSGVGTALTAAIGIFVWKETASLPTVLGTVLIITGVIVLNLKGAH